MVHDHTQTTNIRSSLSCGATRTPLLGTVEAKYLVRSNISPPFPSPPLLLPQTNQPTTIVHLIIHTPPPHVLVASRLDSCDARARPRGSFALLSFSLFCFNYIFTSNSSAILLSLDTLFLIHKRPNTARARLAGVDQQPINNPYPTPLTRRFAAWVRTARALRFYDNCISKT